MTDRDRIDSTPRSRPKTGITSDSPAGRVLQALRAGPMTNGELDERFPGRHVSHILGILARAGLARKDGQQGWWQLTDAGRTACPLRNPLAAVVTPPPAGAAGGRLTANNTPRTTASAPTRSVTTPTHPLEEIAIMSKSTPGPASKARPAIAAAIADIDQAHAISREVLIARAACPDIARNTLKSAIKNMVSEGIVIAACGATSARRYFDVRTQWVADDAPVASKGERAEPSPASAVPAALPRTDAPPPAPANDTAAPGAVEFALYSDGRLAIIDGDDILVLPPEDMRRLVHFLGCFDVPDGIPLPQPLAA